jgi:hypothetical protein
MIGVPPSPHSRLCGAHLVLSAKLLGDNERKDDSRDRRAMPVSRVARWTAYRFREMSSGLPPKADVRV